MLVIFHWGLSLEMIKDTISGVEEDHQKMGWTMQGYGLGISKQRWSDPVIHVVLPTAL